MTIRKSHIVIFIVLLILITNSITTAQAAAQGEMMRLAILRIGLEDFSEEEREKVNQAFYKHLEKDERISILSEAQARSSLIPLGIEPYEISDVIGYVHAGQILNVDFVIVGNMDKIGDFVEVTFRVFSMPKGLQKRYPGGKTFYILINEEIPKIVNMIYDYMNLQKQTIVEKIYNKTVKKPVKKYPWLWIAIV